MSNKVRSFWAGSTVFAVGALIGAGLGLLYAPQSGARTRRQLQLLAADAGERADQLVEDAKLAVKQAVDEARKLAVQSFEPRRIAGRHT